MSRTWKDSRKADGQSPQYRVRGAKRTPVDLRKLGRALIDIAAAELAAEEAAARQVAQKRQNRAARPRHRRVGEAGA